MKVAIGICLGTAITAAWMAAQKPCPITGKSRYWVVALGLWGLVFACFSASKEGWKHASGDTVAMPVI